MSSTQAIACTSGPVIEPTSRDPVFLNFYDRTITDYVSRWDLSADRVMHRTIQVDGPPYFRGDPSYDESQADVMLGVDLLATQYAGYRSYAAIPETSEE